VIELNDNTFWSIAPNAFLGFGGLSSPSISDPGGICLDSTLGCLNDGDLAVIYVAASQVPEPAPAMGVLVASVLCLTLMRIAGRPLTKRLFMLACSVLAVSSFPLYSAAWVNPGDSCASANPGAVSPWDNVWMQVPAADATKLGLRGNSATDWSALPADAAVRETPKYPSRNGAAFDVEGPYCQSIASLMSFRLQIQYMVIAGRVTPKFLPTAPGLTPPSETNKSTDQDFGNSGIYIFNRWEVQIIDPSQFDDSKNMATYGGIGVPMGKPIFADPYIET